MSTEKLFVLVMDIAVGFLGFGLSLVLGKFSGRDMNRDTRIFLAKLWGGITVFGVILLFVF